MRQTFAAAVSSVAVASFFAVPVDFLRLRLDLLKDE
jgi:hypothetical protein